MNIFNFRNQLIDEYRSYVTSFIRISDPDVSRFARAVSQEVLSGQIR